MNPPGRDEKQPPVSVCLSFKWWHAKWFPRCFAARRFTAVGVCFFLHVWNYLTGWHNPAVWCCAHRALHIYDGGPLKHFEAVSQLEDDVKLYPEWKALILAHSPHLSYDMYFSLALYNIECVFISKCWCGAQDQLFIDLLIVFLVFLLTDCNAVIFKCFFFGPLHYCVWY